MILAGFDEAGYGPKLGPLTIGWSAFEVPGDTLDATTQAPNLWTLLADAVRSGAKGEASKLWIADSKVIKPRKNGLKHLELGVLAFRSACGAEPGPALARLLGELGACERGPGRGLARQAWFQGLEEVSLPVHAWAGEVATRSERLKQAAAAGGARCLGARVRALDAQTYNEHAERTGNKGALLAEVTIDLLRELRACWEGPLDITVDKQGGRSHYIRLVGRAFPMAPLETVEEGQDASVYTAKTRQGPVRIAFRKGGEDESLPVALASMHCKYLRELLMDRFNHWFQERVPNLKATAGYAVDANRFLDDVGAHLARLEVPREALVRVR